MVSAFAARQRLVLGQVKVADKANEIVAIPKLLDLLAIEGAIVTLDAIGCQRAIAQQILDKKADYVLALKPNFNSFGVSLALPRSQAIDFAWVYFPAAYFFKLCDAKLCRVGGFWD